MAGMNPAMLNIAISLGVMQLARKVPFDDPQVLLYVRIGYVTAQAIILGVYYYITAQIKKKNDLTVLKFVEPPSPLSPEEPKLVTTTVKDYDLAEVSKLLRGVYIGIAMITVMHGYFGYTQPLFIQAIMGVKNLYDAKPVSIHLLGKPAVGDLKRPFAAGGSMFGAASGPQTDAKAIADAEKKVGKKEE